MLLSIASDGRFGRSIVRETCEKICKRKIKDSVWLSWKPWANVPSGQTPYYTKDQFYMLIAIASLHKGWGKNHRPLNHLEIRAISCTPWTIQIVKLIEEGWVPQ